MTVDYSRYYSTHFAHVANPSASRRRLESIRANYRRRLPTPRDAPILEVGPGSGEFLQFAVDECGYRCVEAVDLSGEVVERLAPRYPCGRQIDDTTRFLAEHPRAFRAIVMLHVIDHIPKAGLIDLLAAAYGALAPEGTLIVEVPNMANPLVGLNFRYADFTHETGFTDSSLRQVLRLAGFNSVTVDPFRIPGGSLTRHVQRVLRGVMESLMSIATFLYFGHFENVAVNLIATGTRTS